MCATCSYERVLLECLLVTSGLTLDCLVIAGARRARAPARLRVERAARLNSADEKLMRNLAAARDHVLAEQGVEHSFSSCEDGVVSR